MIVRGMVLGGACGLVLMLGGLSASGVIHSKRADTQHVTRGVDYTDRLIVKLRTPHAGKNPSTAQLRALSERARVALTYQRTMSGDAYVLNLPRRMTLAAAAAVAQRLQTHPLVESAEPDFLMRAAADDIGDADQWEYQPASLENGGINLPGAWAVTTGSPHVTVAVIDSGILPHADLAGRVLPGYDFVSADRSGAFHTANDGDGRDPDPTDPGDWITPQENAGKDPVSRDFFKGCGVHPSSWHGTHVAGTIAAASGSGRGIKGVSWAVKILPVRAWGKCGGYTSDVVDAARWAAGFAVPGAPRNPNPARILNMSLDGPGRCSMNLQLTMNEIMEAGKVIVVAAGNHNTDATNISPASCQGLITVAATNRAGGRASYSNYGSVVTVSAPGGETSPRRENGVLSTSNSGKTAALTDSYSYKQGTSMAAPHVSGIAALMLSANPDLTPQQVSAVLVATARPFPVGTGSDCSTMICGAGIVNAAAAVGRVSRLLKASAAQLDFDAVAPGRNSAEQVVTITNTNQANIALNIVAVHLDGADARDFTKSLDTCSGAALAPGVSCAVGVIFHPSILGPRTARLSVHSDAANPHIQINVSGLGQPPLSTLAARAL